MPSISTCPKCKAQVSIPVGVDAAALVRCPLCAAEFALSEALALAPPELIPVVVPEAHCEEPSDGLELELAEADNEYPLAIPYCELDDTPAVVPRMSAASALRPKRPGTPWWGKAIGVILGGLAGCIVAIYVLAYFLGPRYRELGFPQRIVVGEVIDIPLPFIDRLTVPAAGSRAARKPVAQKPSGSMPAEKRQPRPKKPAHAQQSRPHRLRGRNRRHKSPRQTERRNLETVPIFVAGRHKNGTVPFAPPNSSVSPSAWESTPYGKLALRSRFFHLALQRRWECHKMGAEIETESQH